MSLFVAQIRLDEAHPELVGIDDKSAGASCILGQPEIDRDHFLSGAIGGCVTVPACKPSGIVDYFVTILGAGLSAR